MRKRIIATIQLVLTEDCEVSLESDWNDASQINAVAQLHCVSHNDTDKNVLQLVAQSTNLPERIAD